MINICSLSQLIIQVLKARVDIYKQALHCRYMSAQENILTIKHAMTVCSMTGAKKSEEVKIQN